MKRLLYLLALVSGLAWSSAAHASGRSAPLVGVINLNDASASELDLLPGVGAKSAQKIILYRQKTPFRRVEDLMRVKGFGRKKFSRMRDHLAVEGPSTLTARRETSSSS